MPFKRKRVLFKIGYFISDHTFACWLSPEETSCISIMQATTCVPSQRATWRRTSESGHFVCSVLEKNTSAHQGWGTSYWRVGSGCWRHWVDVSARRSFVNWWRTSASLLFYTGTRSRRAGMSNLAGTLGVNLAAMPLELPDAGWRCISQAGESPFCWGFFLWLMVLLS